MDRDRIRMRCTPGSALHARARLVATATIVLVMQNAGAAVDDAPSKRAQTGHAVSSTLHDAGHRARELGREIGHEAAHAGRSAGHTVRDAAITVAHRSAQIGRAIGEAARDGSRALARGLRGEQPPADVR